MSDFRDISELFGPENGQNGQNEAENEPEFTHFAHPDPEEGPVEWACWLCQAEGPIYTLELMNNETGSGYNYQICYECAERLLGTLEEGKEPHERATDEGGGVD